MKNAARVIKQSTLVKKLKCWLDLDEGYKITIRSLFLFFNNKICLNLYFKLHRAEDALLLFAFQMPDMN